MKDETPTHPLQLSLKELNEIFLKGTGLTDNELKRLIEFYEQTTDNLDMLGKTYHLAWKECHYHLLTLQSFQEARNERRS